MILFPAIDLKDGNVVRLKQGDMDQATVFGDDPAAQAQAFEQAGCDWLHMVDLDGAFAGKPVNTQPVKAICATTHLSTQLGGGIRDMDTIEAWLDAGITRVILGTAALKDPQLVIDGCRAFPGRIVVGIDARDGYVATEGWAETGSMTTAEIAARFEDAGVCAIVFTDIGRDGLLKGVNVEATAELMARTSIPVIASGGLAGREDLTALRALMEQPHHGNLQGVITGRALYDGRLDLDEALAFCAEMKSGGQA